MGMRLMEFPKAFPCLICRCMGLISDDFFEEPAKLTSFWDSNIQTPIQFFNPGQLVKQPRNEKQNPPLWMQVNDTWFYARKWIPHFEMASTKQSPPTSISLQNFP